MVLLLILGVVMVLAIAVLVVLFLMLGKENKKPEGNVVPFKPEIPKSAIKEPDVVPPFEPKVTMYVPATNAPAQDDAYKKRAQELELELKGISLKAETQMNESRLLIENLTEENESLKRQKSELEEAQKKLNELQGQTDGLKIENTNLQSQLDTTTGKVRALEEEMTAFKLQMGQELEKANATVTRLEQEKQDLLSAPKPEPDAALKTEIEALQKDLAGVKEQYAQLQQDYLKLKDLNTHLMDKNDQFQYEMVKARAQSSGLERLSFNYKNQIEDFFKKINAFEINNDQLTKVKNRLEGKLQEVVVQNDELLKKDQLSQFELEKNRSRLAALERECEELKLRIQQGGQQ